MKLVKKSILILIFFCGLSTLEAQNYYYETITKEDAQKYLVKLYEDMQALHPNLFEYYSKDYYDKAYYELMQSLDTAENYNPYKLETAFKKFVALCKDGHSFVKVYTKPIPAKKSKSETVEPTPRDPNIRVLPFMINIVKGKIYANDHHFGNDTIPLKSEIISIGRESAQDWLQEKRGSFSGERVEYVDAQLSKWYPYKYLKTDSCKFGYIPFGSTDTLYKTLYCKINNQQYHRFMCLNIAPSGFMRMIEEKDILSFRALDEGRIGMITMYHFWPVKKMLPLINKALDSLKFYGAKDLIIDLRQSHGGHAESGFALIDRITDKQYRIGSEEQFFIKSKMLTSSNKYMRNIWTSRKYVSKSEVLPLMKAGRDTIITWQVPETKPKNYKNKFSGRIWVLTGSYTFSAATGLASIVQDCKLGIVVGEETGGVPNTYGNPIDQPLTGVLDEKLIDFTYTFPYIKYFRPSGNDSMKLRGVIPNIEIEPNIYPKEDIQLLELIEIIKKTDK